MPLSDVGSADRPARAAALAVAILLLAGLAVVDGDLAGSAPRAWLPLALRGAMLATGLALAAFGLAGGREGRAGDWTRGEVALVLALTGAAFAIRAWRLDALRVLIDEGNSIDTLFHAYRPDTPLLLPPNVYVTTMLYPAWQALVVAVAGPTLSAFRLSSALLGALTVPALWLLARELFGRPTALAAAVVLAGFAPHVHFSRVGLPHIADALFGTAALAGIARGLNGGRLAWALGGIALGLTHYGFEAGRWFFTPLVVVWLVMLRLLAPERLRGAGPGVARLVVASLLTLVPLCGALLGSGGDIAPRLRASSLDGREAAALLADPRALGARLALAAGAYVSQPEQQRYYGGDDSLLTPLLAPFALLGAALSIARPRAPALLIPLWLVAAWLANAVMREPLVFARWVVAFPALALATARGASAVGGWLGGARTERRAALATVVLAALLSLAQLHRYFGTHLEPLAEQARADKPYRDAIDAALRAASLLPRGDVLVISEPLVDVHPPRSLLRLLRAGGDDLRLEVAAPSAVDAGYLAALPGDRDHAFFVAPDDAATVARLGGCFALDGPQPSPYPVAPEKRLDLYLARVGSRRASCGS